MRLSVAPNLISLFGGAHVMLNAWQFLPSTSQRFLHSACRVSIVLCLADDVQFNKKVIRLGIYSLPSLLRSIRLGIFLSKAD